MQLLHIGFTGSRNMMSKKQLTSLKNFFIELQKRSIKEDVTIVFHHGCCVGSDHQAHNIALRFGFKIHLHPPINKKLVFNYGEKYDYIEIDKDYIDRNHDIVNACDFIVCCPKEEREQRRSGTWATIRYARSTFIELIVIYPSGNYTTI